MTDQELIAQLRDTADHARFEPHLHHTAADRLETANALLRGFIAAWDRPYSGASQADAREAQHKAIEAAAQPIRVYLGAKP